jgi:hypothetical protein
MQTRALSPTGEVRFTECVALSHATSAESRLVAATCGHVHAKRLALMTMCGAPNQTPRRGRYRTKKKIGNGEQQQRGLFNTGRPALPEPVDNFGPPGRRHVDFASSKKIPKAWTLRHQRRSITWTLRHRWRWSRPRNLPVSLTNRAVRGRCTKICYKDPYKSKWIIRL